MHSLPSSLTPYVSDTSDDSEDEEYGIKKAVSVLLEKHRVWYQERERERESGTAEVTFDL